MTIDIDELRRLRREMHSDACDGLEACAYLAALDKAVDEGMLDELERLRKDRTDANQFLAEDAAQLTRLRNELGAALRETERLLRLASSPRIFVAHGAYPTPPTGRMPTEAEMKGCKCFHAPEQRIHFGHELFGFVARCTEHPCACTFNVTER